MSTTERDDPTWQTAWAWVSREHEQTLAPQARAEMIAWLQADPLHRKAYDDAARLWLLVGLVPPVNDLPGGEDADSSPDK